MFRLRSLFSLVPQLWNTLRSRPITVRYPFEPLNLPAYFRGRVVCEEENCRGCGLCVRDCPANGLILERNGKQGFRLIHYPDRCAYCGQCEENCPQSAIRLTSAYVHATTDREALVHVLVDRWEGDDGRRTTNDGRPTPAWVTDDG
jgi:formate hydrogenlyase subunit 6/NADH:ubiquinone oxidoreductase subunit I